MNPFFEDFKTTFETVPFGKIENKHFLPALKKSIEIAEENILKITTCTNLADFNNTIIALENCDEKIGTVSGVFFNLLSAETNDDLQDLAKEFSPLLTEYSNSIALNSKLFERVKSVYDSRDSLRLESDELMLLEKKYKYFSRNGALLSDKEKNQLREIDQSLSKKTLEFSDNVLKETNSFELFIDDLKELDGLPEGAIEAAAITAKEKGREGQWAFTLDYPSMFPVITYATNRKLRENISRASALKACQGNEFDNKNHVKEIACLRYKRAVLLGYNSHADFILEERMAKDPQTVKSFLDEITEHALPAGKTEVEELKAFALKEDSLEDFKSWDYFYYFEKLKKKLFDIDDEMLRPYFKLENVINGVFLIAKKLYGVSFKERNDIEVYHKDVKAYEVLDSKGTHLAVFYADFFPREGKRNGAWMTEYRSQEIKDEKNIRPHVSIVCNFTKPTEKKPSLLSFGEVTTLFHEFGHALHGMLSNTRFESLSGTSVLWDFVELPSQIMENWAYEKECLDLFAKHYETEQAIPAELIEKIKVSANFHEGRTSIRQVSFALLDMSWHDGDPSLIDNVDEFEAKSMNRFQLLPRIEGTNMSSSFSHIFAGGYSAAYYSYKWAEVLDADAFELFKEKGIFSQEVANSFRLNILEKGGSMHPMDLYVEFRGKKPSAAALLKRGGLK